MGLGVVLTSFDYYRRRLSLIWWQAEALHQGLDKMIIAPINFELNIHLQNILQIVAGEQDQISIADGELSFTLSFCVEDPLFL